MDSRKKEPQKPGASKASPDVVLTKPVVNGTFAVPVDNSARQEIAEIDLAPEKPATELATAFVDDKRVKYLAVLLRHPMFLIDPEMGTHEATRVYCYPDGTVRCSERQDGKIGPAVVKRVEFVRGVGLTVVTQCAKEERVMFSPVSDCQACWTV